MSARKPIPSTFQQVGTQAVAFHNAASDAIRAAPRFFDGVLHSGIASDDRIDLIALGDTPATHAILVMDSIANEPASASRVSVLTEYRTQEVEAAA